MANDTFKQEIDYYLTERRIAFNKKFATKKYKDRHKTKKQAKPLMWKGVTEGRRSFFVWRGAHRQESSKERELRMALNQLGIKYYREISFDQRKRYDFYLPDFDTVIEYDGEQHFGDLKEMYNDEYKEQVLFSKGVKVVRYNRRSGNLLACVTRDFSK